MSRPVHVYVFGAGGVGQAFLAQLDLLRPKHPNLHLAAVTTSRFSVSSPTLSLTSWPSLATSPQHPALTPAAVLALCQAIPAPGKAVVVDNTSSATVAASYPVFLAAGVSVVTPNKKAFSDSLEVWRNIRLAAWPASPSGGLVYHESSCGAGLPVLSTLADLVATGDEVSRIEGVFSGTMSFLFNSFAPVQGEGGRWSEEVANAKALGYTEPDPRDDLNGLDVARKLVILARLAGLEVQDTGAFPVQSLIPKELEACASGDEFLERLPEFDAQMEGVKERAKKAGKVVRFVGSIDVPSKTVKVGLEEFGVDHPIAALKGADNIISFHTKRYSGSPLIIQGAGAGADVTAMGVTADLIKVLQRIDSLA